MVGMLIDLNQDAEFVVPLARECRELGIAYCVFVSRAAQLRDPELIKRLRSLNLNFDREILPRKVREKHVSWWRWPQIGKCDSFLTAVESNAGPHRLAHEVVKRANAGGIKTFTMQHGFENIGLTYSDMEYPIENVLIESQHIFTWGPLPTLHPGISDKMKAKCIPVGVAKEYPLGNEADPSLSKNVVVGIFENLHWSRYDQSFREWFISLIEILPQNFPSVEFHLKPHPAGKWLTERFRGTYKKASNLVVWDQSTLKEAGISNNDFIARCHVVLTTPSSVAIDGVVLGKPTLLLGHNLNLQNYSPLSIGRDIQEVRDFLNEAFENPQSCAKINENFLNEKIIRFNAFKDILNWVKGDKL
jgi:hypothetical protein